jgi:hypothetical protein
VSASVTARYDADNGPVLFGVPGIDVRWNRNTRTLIVEADDNSGGRWSIEGDLACDVIVALAAAHRRGQMKSLLMEVFRPAHCAWADEWYRCGKLLLRRAA